MKRTLLVLALFFGVIVGAKAQLYPDSLPTDRPLNATELNQKKWYYDLEEALAEPDQVYKLSLAGQKLKSLPPEISTLTHLQMLDLGDNKLKTLPVEISELKHLQFLSLYNNRLRYLPEEIRKLDRIEVLFLSRNKLIDVPVWVGGLGNLRRLDLMGNRFTPLEIKRIRNMLPNVEITP